MFPVVPALAPGADTANVASKRKPASTTRCRRERRRTRRPPFPGRGMRRTLCVVLEPRQIGSAKREEERMDDFVQVLVAAGSREEAARLSKSLVSRRQAACVQVLGPITSTYRWKGEIEVAEEWLCIA